MMDDFLVIKSKEYLKSLCEDFKERCVGSDGNRQATTFMAKELSSLNWRTELIEFDAIDWEEKGAILKSGEEQFNVLVSPYSPGFRGKGELISASTIEELSTIDAKNKIVLLLVKLPGNN